MDLGKLILVEMGFGGGNASSGGIAAYESPATRKVSSEEFINKRYGCDKKSNHHSATRCKIQGRMDQLKLAFASEVDPLKRMKIQQRILVWQEKLKNELRKSRFRKD